jgi:acyl-CoA dehydrogenase
MNRLFALSPVGMSLLEQAESVADQVASKFADDVDAASRFPSEAMEALQHHGLLGAYAPTGLGGHGATITDIAAICHALGQRCSSTAMIFAMHQIQMACLVHHGLDTDVLRGQVADIATRQQLVASATTELGVGGDVRTSLCAVDLGQATFNLRKEASVISYADAADAILVTARRSPDAAASDQVIALARIADSTLTPISNWDTMGMRGTCSVGYVLETTGPSEHVLSLPYADISSQTMLPVSHIVWASLWLGIATDAVNRARASLRTAARQSVGQTPPNAGAVASLFGDLEMVRATVSSAVAMYEAVRAREDHALTTGESLRISVLKTSVATAVRNIVTGCLQICGIAGYRNDTKFSVGRHLRDVHSAALMVHNERVLANVGRVLCVYRED